MAVKIGDKIPSFKLKNQNGTDVYSSSLVGDKNLVIYFYPKDDTPGCTKESCSFRDAYEDFLELDAEVIGISSDDETSHKKFAEKHRLPFDLLADSKKTVRKAFGVPGNLFGLIPGRVTYIIDKSGVVRSIFNSQTDPVGHISEAKKVLKSLK
ncbi:MAG: peroxiredoxin [Lishizhenia sp.]